MSNLLLLEILIYLFIYLFIYLSYLFSYLCLELLSKGYSIKQTYVVEYLFELVVIRPVTLCNQESTPWSR